MIKLKRNRKAYFAFFVLLSLLAASLMVAPVQASITLPVRTFLPMPTYGTELNFLNQVTFSNLWRESSTNTSYPEYWMLLNSDGSLFGLQSSSVSFTVNTVLTASSLSLTWNQSGTGTVNVYCGLYGAPSTYNSSSLSYDAATKIASAARVGVGGISLGWSVAPTPTPTITPAPTATPTPSIAPTPTATPTPTLTLTIMQPFNRTYIIPNIPVELATTGLGVTVSFNVKNGTSWVYGANQTYGGPVTLTQYSAGTYTFYAWASDAFGNTASSQISFEVETLTQAALPQINNDAFWLFLYEGDFLGFMQARLVMTFLSFETAIATIVLLLMLPIYLKTKSLLLLSILWILIGGFFIAAVPMASGIAVLFTILGIGGLLWRLARGSSYN